MLPSAVHLLPTPAVNDMGAAYTPDEWDARTERMKAEHGCGEACGGHSPQAWGAYEAAIRRWEVRLSRPAPAPTRLSAKGKPQLSADFVEFLMGLPVGHVTGVPGVTHNEALRMLGNGVVPQQAVAALTALLSAATDGS